MKKEFDLKYSLVTDSGCDLPKSYLNTEGIECVHLGFYFENDEKLMNDCDISQDDFYSRMRNGEIAKTSAPGPDVFERVFRPVLKDGRDILYIGFDSALSTTVNSARIAADELCEEYPDRKILILDSLCASAGQGLLVAMTQRKIKTGITIDAAYEYARMLAPKIAHRFTVETLTYLCRGGRIGKAAAMTGNLLNIKPVLHADDEGRLINLLKVRGRTKSFSMLLDAYEHTALSLNSCTEVAAGAENITIADSEYDFSDQMVMISHADSKEDAEKLAHMFQVRFNKTVDMICSIGPVIGAHSGPGTVALFFVANER